MQTGKIAGHFRFAVSKHILVQACALVHSLETISPINASYDAFNERKRVTILDWLGQSSTEPDAAYFLAAVNADEK